MMKYLKEKHSDIQLAQQRQNVTAAGRKRMHHFNQRSNHWLNACQTFHNKIIIYIYRIIISIHVSSNEGL